MTIARLDGLPNNQDVGTCFKNCDALSWCDLFLDTRSYSKGLDGLGSLLSTSLGSSWYRVLQSLLGSTA